MPRMRDGFLPCSRTTKTLCGIRLCDSRQIFDLSKLFGISLNPWEVKWKEFKGINTFQAPRGTVNKASYVKIIFLNGSNWCRRTAQSGYNVWHVLFWFGIQPLKWLCSFTLRKIYPQIAHRKWIANHLQTGTDKAKIIQTEYFIRTVKSQAKGFLIYWTGKEYLGRLAKMQTE